LIADVEAFVRRQTQEDLHGFDAYALVPNVHPGIAATVEGAKGELSPAGH